MVCGANVESVFERLSRFLTESDGGGRPDEATTDTMPAVAGP